ncbi:MAG: hypothetical protein JWQ57_606 [Mucilaginibacter sp.]|nr:hypothetical protein [Mucilaginibacter sp.]
MSLLKKLKQQLIDIKKEIQKKLLNELAELFLFKSKHMEAVIREFSKVLDDLPEDKRKEILNKIGSTKELTEKIEIQTKTIQELKKSEEIFEGKLINVKGELEQAKDEKKTVKNRLEKEINNLRKELSDIKMKISIHENVNADFLISGSSGSNVGLLQQPITYNSMPYSSNSLYYSGVSPYSLTGAPINLGYINPSFSPVYEEKPKCDKCHQAPSNGMALISQPLTNCPTCNRNLCKTCFNGSAFNVGFYNECADCRAKNSKISLTNPLV